METVITGYKVGITDDLGQRRLDTYLRVRRPRGPCRAGYDIEVSTSRRPLSTTPYFEVHTSSCKVHLERPRTRAVKGNDVNEDLGGVRMQGNEEDLSLRPRAEKETLKISRRRLYMQN